MWSGEAAQYSGSPGWPRPAGALWREPLTVEEAAAGMYRVACNNMAQGVREGKLPRLLAMLLPQIAALASWRASPVKRPTWRRSKPRIWSRSVC